MSFYDDLSAYNNAKTKLYNHIGKKVKVYYFNDKVEATIINVDINRLELDVRLECERHKEDYETPANKKPVYHIPFTHFENYGLEFC